MKQQYLGDVNDYRKFCLLRHFAIAGGAKVGMCWMLTPDDGGRDGRKLAYLDQPSEWREHDPELFDGLKAIVHGDVGRQLRMVEDSGLIPGALYYDQIVPDPEGARASYMRRALSALAEADFLFFDPDNGLEISSKPKGRLQSSKFLYWDEVAKADRPGRSLLIYQHFTREARQGFAQRLGERLRDVTRASDIWGIHSPHVLFLLATSMPQISACAENLPARFGMRAERL
ncbi:hypothetical protein [Aestuariivirga sp.]|uniref:hypothetical protein n=1 Tax=Aestuariivirga sp. TaxID=2650926 RepID=UPI0039E2AA97